MRAAIVRHSAPDIRIRPGVTSDLDALVDLEERVFSTDRMSRRSLRRFLGAESAALLVAERAGGVAGYALVLFRRRSGVARLYSIAVDPGITGRGVGTALLGAAEDAAAARACAVMRLEAHEANARAISRYESAGYRLFGRYVRYYEDGGDALRYEKSLAPLGAAAHGSRLISTRPPRSPADRRA
ncbi:MAG TPA: GNAT family N-acetyltransferase [Xanthobacteraceae bacterium]|nr:GNAT family N-acetyltransferase [Xanthobacteraceae bacterium]